MRSKPTRMFSHWRSYDLINCRVVNKIPGHAFISYVREDSAHVDRLQQRLEAAGIRVWRDTAELWPGDDWRARIRHAIADNTLVFIACFSRTSVSRDTSYQNEELALAVEQLRLRRPDIPWLIPVRFDDCDIPDLDLGSGRTLQSIQRADLFGDKSTEGATRLVTAILRILESTSDTAVSDEDKTSQIAEKLSPLTQFAQRRRRVTPEDLEPALAAGDRDELRFIIKGDVPGSLKALEDALLKLDVGENVTLRVIGRGVGAITQDDVESGHRLGRGDHRLQRPAGQPGG